MAAAAESTNTAIRSATTCTGSRETCHKGGGARKNGGTGSAGGGGARGGSRGGVGGQGGVCGSRRHAPTASHWRHPRGQATAGRHAPTAVAPPPQRPANPRPQMTHCAGVRRQPLLGRPLCVPIEEQGQCRHCVGVVWGASRQRGSTPPLRPVWRRKCRMPRVAAGARSQPQAAVVLLRRRDTRVPLQPWPRAREENSGVGSQPWLACAAPRRWGPRRPGWCVPSRSRTLGGWVTEGKSGLDTLRATNTFFPQRPHKAVAGVRASAGREGPTRRGRSGSSIHSA